MNAWWTPSWKQNKRRINAFSNCRIRTKAIIDGMETSRQAALVESGLFVLIMQ